MGNRPFVVGVTDIIRRPGTRRPVHRAAPFAGIAVSTAAVAPGEDVAVDLELEAIANGVVADGTVTVPWAGACRRCLEPVRGTVVADVREIFERRAVEGETYAFDGDLVDLEPMLRDAVLLTLPLAPLCRDDCPGPDPDAFPAIVAGEGDGDEQEAEAEAEPAPTGDSRWAVLDQLTFE